MATSTPPNKFIVTVFLLQIELQTERTQSPPCIFILQNNEINSCKSALKAVAWAALTPYSPSNPPSGCHLQCCLRTWSSSIIHNTSDLLLLLVSAPLVLRLSDTSHLDLIWVEWPVQGWEEKKKKRSGVIAVLFVLVHHGLCSHSIVSRWSLLIYKGHDYFIVLTPASTELDYRAWEFTCGLSLKSNFAPRVLAWCFRSVLRLIRFNKALL